MTTDPTTTGHIGSGWPDPTEPGVPARGLEDGYHWLQWQDDRSIVFALWEPDTWSWIVFWCDDRLCPEEMDHFNYLGPCRPPSGSHPTV